MPGKPFYVEVKDIGQAIWLYNILADYDEFQYRHNVKPDYSNAGGLETFEDGDWTEWYNEDGDDFREVMDIIIFDYKDNDDDDYDE